jgi:hypothetical protein
MPKIPNAPEWTIAVATLVSLVSCTHDIDLSRLDTGPTDADGDVDGDADNDGDGDADNDVDGDADGEADGDLEADIDFDIDFDIVGEPLITGIDGDGSSRSVSGDTTGVPAPSPASHRFRYAWMVRGERLDTVTSARLEQTSGGTAVFTAADGLEFEEGGTALERRLLLPAALTAGAFTLTLMSPHGDAVAQTYILQGEPGEDGADGRDGAGLDCAGGTCTLDQNLVVEGDGTFSGDLYVAGGGTFDTLEANELTVSMSIWLPECPSGYTRDETVDDFVLCTNGRDQMVKVGDIWVDRYEASVWGDAGCTTGIRAGVPYGSEAEDYPDTFPDSGQVNDDADLLYACAVSGVTPSRWLTWFQAQTACEASGKHLCSNAEWQAAVAGTVDPGSSTADVGACRTGPGPTGPRPTGRAGATPGGAGSCISLWGAEDMIGNLWEWTADWGQAGRGWDAGFSDGASTAPWPSGYGDGGDRTWNLDGRSSRDAVYANGLPAAAFRGGGCDDGSRAGAFAVYLGDGPSSWHNGIGFRCCLGR